MYVCLCKSVTDKDIYEALENGAHSIRDIKKQCGLGTVCGQCRPLTQEMIEEYRHMQGGSPLSNAVGLFQPKS